MIKYTGVSTSTRQNTFAGFVRRLKFSWGKANNDDGVRM